MPRIAKVGDGWSGTEDYLTLALWWSAEASVDYGDIIEASCKGYLGASADLTGTSINGAKVYADSIVYDGSNETLLPTTTALKVSTTSPIQLDSIISTTTNQYVSAFTIATDTLISNNCIFDNQTAGVNAITISGYYPNSSFSNFVARGGLDTLSAGYLRGTNFNKGIIYGAAGYGVNGSAGAGKFILTDVFAFDNVTDFENSTITLNTCASQDTTGSAGLTNYTNTELVDFANKDFRTKSSSPLAISGSNGTFVGAFLEVSGTPGISVTVQVQGNEVESAILMLKDISKLNTVTGNGALSLLTSTAALVQAIITGNGSIAVSSNISKLTSLISSGGGSIAEAVLKTAFLLTTVVGGGTTSTVQEVSKVLTDIVSGNGNVVTLAQQLAGILLTVTGGGSTSNSILYGKDLVGSTTGAGDTKLLAEVGKVLTTILTGSGLVDSALTKETSRTSTSTGNGTVTANLVTGVGIQDYITANGYTTNTRTVSKLLTPSSTGGSIGFLLDTTKGTVVQNTVSGNGTVITAAMLSKDTITILTGGGSVYTATLGNFSDSNLIYITFNTLVQDTAPIMVSIAENTSKELTSYADT